MPGKNGHDIDLLRETAHLLRNGETASNCFEGEAPHRYNPEGAPPWEYRITFDPATGLYCLEITRWTHYVNIPATLYEPAEVGWQDDQWGDYESPTLAEVFRKLEWEGLPLPL